MEQMLFYKAKTTGNMWDTWLYWRKGTYYLFHLAGPGGQWHGIAMATSGDGVHWREHGLVLEKADDVTWLGTGSVWEAPSRGSGSRFILNFSEWRGKAQTFFFAESSDLLNWRRMCKEHEFRPDGRWYNAGGDNAGRWDCIYTIDRPGGGRYGYWTANPLDFTGFGFGETDDGITWRALRLKWWPENSVAIREWKPFSVSTSEADVSISYEPSAGMILGGSLRIPQNPDDAKSHICPYPGFHNEVYIC